MNPTSLFIPKNRQELREWLTLNGATSPDCWVVINQESHHSNLSYLDIVEEAICFGWIDSTKKKVSENELAQRISPRRKNSNWTELNKARARRLIEGEQMTVAGQKTLPDLSIERFVIDPEILSEIEKDPVIQTNFLNFPALYQRIRIDTIQAYKSDPSLYEKRLAKFLENTRENKMYGLWNDQGRLEK